MPPLAPTGFRGVFRDDRLAREVYAETAGIARAVPRAVAVPADADDVSTLVRWAADVRTPIIPRGSGSSMGGGAAGEGVIIDLSRLRSISVVDAARSTIRVGPGMVCAEVDAAAAAHDLRFPVDPSSAPFCTIGGMVATNAAGAHTLRYGATREWVQALDCVFTNGERARIERGASGIAALPEFVRSSLHPLRRSVSPPAFGVRKNSSGYALDRFDREGDVVDLLVGSEGTLALFVGVELRLAPRPGATASLLGAFRSLDDAVVAAGAARDAGAAACELLDRTFLDIAREGGARVDVPAESDAVLLVEVEGDSPAQSRELVQRIASAFTSARASQIELGLDPETEHRLWDLRHAASPILSRLAPAIASMQFIEDGVVPPARLADYVRGVRAALDARGMRGVIFGHAGDAHIHVNPLVDVRQPDWRSQVESLLEDVTALVISLGGTPSGEHGDGRLRAPLLPRVWPAEAVSRFQAIKNAFDPDGILNPGVKLPLPGQRPIAAVKYDAALPPLEARARQVLDDVALRRAYAENRLDLLAKVTGDI